MSNTQKDLSDFMMNYVRDHPDRIMYFMLNNCDGKKINKLTPDNSNQFTYSTECDEKIKLFVYESMKKIDSDTIDMSKNRAEKDVLGDLIRTYIREYRLSQQIQ